MPYDSDLTKTVNMVHLCNCVTKVGRGLSRAMFAAHPWANDYRDRSSPSTPGTVNVHEKDGKKVFNMFAQYYPGKPGVRTSDTREMRLGWFEDCLRVLRDRPETHFDFPLWIGCGLGGGHWPDYKARIYTILKDKRVTFHSIRKVTPTLVCVKVSELRKQRLKTFAEWNALPHTLYIGRSVRYVDGTFDSPWGNPYSASKYGREKCIEMYKTHLTSLIDSGKVDPRELAGRELGCWCHPKACHGDVLREYVAKNF